MSGTDLDDWRSMVDDARAIVDEDFGLRPTRVFIVTEVWASGTTGQGTPTTTELEIEPRPVVNQVSVSDYQIERITPAYDYGAGSSGGYTVAQLVPPQPKGTVSHARLEFEDGSVRRCRIQSVSPHKPFGYMLALTDRDMRAR